LKNYKKLKKSKIRKKREKNIYLSTTLTINSMNSETHVVVLGADEKAEKDTLEKFYKILDEKYKKFKKYNRRAIVTLLIFLFSGFGILPLLISTSYVLSAIDPKLYDVFIILFWLLTVVVFMLFIIKFIKLRNKNQISFDDFLFLHTYKTKQKINDNISYPDTSHIIDAIKYLKEVYHALNQEIKSISQILGLIDEDKHEKLLNITEKIKHQIIPYLREEKYTDSIVPILNKLALFFKDSVQWNLIDEIEKDLEILPKYPETKVGMEGIISKFSFYFNSEKLPVKILSWSLLFYLPILLSIGAFGCLIIYMFLNSYWEQLMANILLLILGIPTSALLLAVMTCGIKK